MSRPTVSHRLVVPFVVAALLPLVAGAAPARDHLAPVPEAIYAGVPRDCVVYRGCFPV